MKFALTLALFCGWSVSGVAQQWVDTTYAFKTIADEVYGTAKDFAGNERTLFIDIKVPSNDQPPACGRPLLIFVHGGGFIGGSRADNTSTAFTDQFAKRGYVAASASYRYGYFNTASAVHCNLTGWDCLNAQDTAEWYRANYRGMQDIKGAIRYMIKQKGIYNIDARNVFVVGESAGGFIALQVGYLDSSVEKSPLCGPLPDASMPNSIYENACIQNYGWDSSIAHMQLQRPDLGSVHGTLHLGYGYTIKGIGSFYGGALGTMFNLSNGPVPRLYTFHQPNDLLVPYKKGRVYDGVSACAMTYAGCGNIVNRPMMLGGSGLRTLIQQGGSNLPLNLFDSTLNQADCLTQLSNQATAGHAIDNITFRSHRMAVFFAPVIETNSPCTNNITDRAYTTSYGLVYPNPAHDYFKLNDNTANASTVQLLDLTGRVLVQYTRSHSAYPLPSGLPLGLYFIQIQIGDQKVLQKLLVQ